MRLRSLLLLALLGLAACAGGEAPPPTAGTTPAASPTAVAVASPRTPDPAAPVPELALPPAGPIRPGCGDFRLLVTVETTAAAVGLRVSGPEGVVDGVWTLVGPHLGAAGEAEEPRTINDDNRDLFGIEGNEPGQGAEAAFLLLLSGVQPGEGVVLEMGQEGPEGTRSRIAFLGTADGLEAPGPELARVELREGYRTLRLDLCGSARPLPAPTAAAAKLPPRIFAFFYPWWSTRRCGGDDFGWIREHEGRTVLVTAHTPIDRDGAQVLYRQTRCWDQVADDDGRRGRIYDVFDPPFLAEQMALAKAYGIDGFAVSVHGDNEVEMAFLGTQALPTAERVGFSIAALYEAPEGGWSGDDERDAATVARQLQDLVRTLAASPAAVRVPNARGEEGVLIFVDPALPWRFPAPEAWAAIRAAVDQAGIPYALWSGPGPFPWVFFAGFDGVYNDLEVVETLEAPLGLPPYALRDERRLAYRATAWLARERGLPFALAVVPGWERAPGVKVPDHVPLPRDYGAPGDLGRYYRVRWEDALEEAPDWIVITSWNEWVEGTELEPSEVYPPSRFDYLLATWRYACRWRGGEGCP